ncbi:uncharacterized protein Z519_06840 [Cladophialophora bantiana CBS 173.52]|uniref:YAG7-like dimerisation domain-containing protein n=1 Tax=Cladophialophora bantiana (strain ATCC 10958 / CBS 173.52 / CDC B-1940 / NIH 8579) TaxID=1442370 RepID=A0A0D2ET03_CLAB1|nr:uncharacterized protein Z519_06840 [Cladophialophora bantiana CBS 173.52]KIW92991.1 hypothetical protein Z519_06840 [Cladophialophora bantiana CBS 173.52]
MSTTSTVPVESKSAKKRKAKADAAAANGGAVTPTIEAPVPTTETHPTTNGVDSHGESQFIKDLTKNIRNLHKKIAASAKADAVISENPNVSLDDLVAQKKLNTDQKAQILKKPALQNQVAQLEEQLSHFRAFAQELEEKAAKEKSKLIEAHEAEIAIVKEKALQEIGDIKTKAVEDGLRVITHFLHTAASKRQSEEADSDEGRAFEGALLLVYQGNESSLSTLQNLIHGTDDKVPDVHGEPLDFTFAQIKESCLQSAHGVVQSTEPDIQQEVEADEAPNAAVEVGVDNTVANAALTELDDTAAILTDDIVNETAEPDAVPSVPEQSTTGEEAANAVAEAWDPQASIVTDTSATNEEWVQVRVPTETETGLAATPAAIRGSNSWAEEVGAAAATTAEEKPAPENDGFEQVRRERGRGRGGRGGRGEFRGRGRGGRGDSHRGGGGRGRGDGQGGPRAGRGGGGLRVENKS